MCNPSVLVLNIKAGLTLVKITPVITLTQIISNHYSGLPCDLLGNSGHNRSDHHNTSRP